MTQQQDRIIVADIGGTNGRFAVATVEDGEARLEHLETLDNSTYAGLPELVGDYLGRLGDGAPNRACLAIAGPSDGRRGAMVNLPWVLDAGELEQRFGFEDVRLVNDFAGQAAMLHRFGDDDVHCLNPGKPMPGPMAVCGPGTGLGVGLSVPVGADNPTGNRADNSANSTNREVVCTEGGHIRFTATTPLERELQQFLAPEGGYLAAEEAWSGPGIVRIYRFFCERSGAPVNHETPAAITGAALDGSDPLCRETLDCFLAGLGAIAGDVALMHGATGGLYLAGGILPRILPLLEQSDFLERFFDHGPLEDYLRAVPVYLVTSGTTALRGAAHLYFG